jgi:hypothetical protein
MVCADSIVNLRIENTRLTKRTVHSLSFWIRRKSLLHSFGIKNVKFEENSDFKILLESISLSKRIKALSIGGVIFDSQMYGGSIG